MRLHQLHRGGVLSSLLGLLLLVIIPTATLCFSTTTRRSSRLSSVATKTWGLTRQTSSSPLSQRRQRTLLIQGSSNDDDNILANGEHPSPDQQEGEETALNEKGIDPEFLKEALLENVIFANLPEESLEALIQAFDCALFEKGDVILRQGDSCEDDYVYIIYDGECTVEVDGKMVPRPYGTLGKQAIFGELGVLYNRTRAATITCKSPTVTVYRIPCSDFKQILNQGTTATTTSTTPLTQQDAESDEEMEELLDNVMKEIEGTKTLYDGNIIRPYRPERLWLWSRFTGTVLQHVALPTIVNMLWSLCFIAMVRRHIGGSGGGPFWQGRSFWKGLLLPPDPTNPFIAKLRMVHKIWNYQQGLTTFILTFFLNQAFSFWQEIYNIGRAIQGRLNDFNIVLATTASRSRDGSFTAKSESLLDDVGRYSRLFHALLWASQAKRFRVLQTTRGLERMASRGLMTPKQLEVLLQLDLPENQRHNACLEWMMIRTDMGIQDGTLLGDPAHRQMLLAKMTDLRSTFATINDKLDGRMPLPYAHMVQVLVDVFVWTAPVALYAELGAWSVICVGVLTLFYTGLLDLAKIFLDPLDNEDFCKNSIFMDIGVLIRESNAGSTRWKRGAAKLPF